MSSYKEPDLEDRQRTTAKAKTEILKKGFVQPPKTRLWRSDKLPEWR